MSNRFCYSCEKDLNDLNLLPTIQGKEPEYIVVHIHGVPRTSTTIARPFSLRFCCSCWGKHTDSNNRWKRRFDLRNWIKFAGVKWTPYLAWHSLKYGDRIVPKFHEEAAKAFKWV